MSEDTFSNDDGAYVIGSLSPADTAKFETHLETCDDCMRRVAALWDVPPMFARAPLTAFEDSAKSNMADTAIPPSSLARLPVATASPDPAFPDDLLPRLLDQISRSRRRPRVSTKLIVTVAAACVAALLLAVVTTVALRSSSGSKPVAAAPVKVTNAVLAADLTISTHDSWDQVNLTCTYRSKKFVRQYYRAVATDSTGRTELVGTWPIIPGQTATIHTPTTFHSGRITSVTILDATGTRLANLKV